MLIIMIYLLKYVTIYMYWFIIVFVIVSWKQRLILFQIA